MHSILPSLLKEYSDVNTFHMKFGVPMPDTPTLLGDDAYNFRLKFLHEEFNEYVGACESNDLATAFDSLIDLVYVSNGTALMLGFKADDWKVLNDRLGLDLINKVRDHFQTNAIKPGFLSTDEYNDAITCIRNEIYSFVGAHAAADLDGCLYSLYKLSLAALYTAFWMGANDALWNELWDDVQRANMSKVRATTVEQSKRKSTLDVIKPEGWVGPDTQGILNKYL